MALATSAYGISFGALAVASGLDRLADLRAEPRDVHRRLAVRLRGRHRGRRPARGAGRDRIGIASGRAQRRVRHADVAGRSARACWRRAAAAQFTIDESTAVSLAQTTPRARTLGFWVTGIAIYIGWNLSTLAGALLGDVLGDPRAYGLDAAAAAAFLALLWPRLRHRQPIAVGIAAAVVATVLTPALMPGMPVLIAAVVAVVVGWFNWLGADDEPPEEPEDVAERVGLP